jgi:hypothetical protein
VDPKTVKHLQISARNRDLARALLDSAQAGLQPSPWEWVAAIAFYAAVHAVNAYLWETQRYKPASHGDRRSALQVALPLRACIRSYGFLNQAGFDARYDETYTLSELGARTLLDVEFRRVEATVMQALGHAAPAW